MNKVWIIVILLVLFVGIVVTIQQINKSQEAKAKDALFQSLANNTAKTLSYKPGSGLLEGLITTFTDPIASLIKPKSA